MMNSNRCQRRTYNKQKLSKEITSVIKSFKPEKENLFEYFMNRSRVNQCFAVSYKWLAHICGVGLTTVKEWVAEFIALGFIQKRSRFNVTEGKHYVNTYAGTPYLRMVIKVFLPLLPTLYSFCNSSSFKEYNNFQTGKVTTCYNKEVLLSEGNNNNYLFTMHSKRTLAMLHGQRSEEMREATLGLTYGGPGSPQVTWFRGNAPEIDNSIVEKEREMAKEDYEEYKTLFPNWNNPYGNRTQDGTKSHKLDLPNTRGQQNHASKVNEPIKREEPKKKLEQRIYQEEIDTRVLSIEQSKLIAMCFDLKKNNPELWKKKLNGPYSVSDGIKSMWPHPEYTDEDRAKILDYLIKSDNPNQHPLSNTNNNPLANRKSPC